MPTTDTATALLDAHVAWIENKLQGPALKAEVSRLLDGFLEDASQVLLRDVISPAAIHETIEKYAVELDLGAAMPELVGDIVHKLFKHKIHEQTRLCDLMPDRHFRELLDKLLEFNSLREAAIHESVHSPIFSSLISELIYQGILDYTTQNTQRASKLPGGKAALKLGKAVWAKAPSQLSEGVADGIKNQVQRNTESSLKASQRHLNRAFESDEFRSMVLDLWSENKHLTVAELRRNINSLDLEELFVILYEFWQEFRRTSFFTTIVNSGVDRVLQGFGELDLATLLQEIGITREMMIDDAMRFAPPVVAHLQKKGLLKPALRRLLADFYASDTVADILNNAGANA